MKKAHYKVIEEIFGEVDSVRDFGTNKQAAEDYVASNSYWSGTYGCACYVAKYFKEV